MAPPPLALFAVSMPMLLAQAIANFRCDQDDKSDNDAYPQYYTFSGCKSSVLDGRYVHGCNAEKKTEYTQIGNDDFKMKKMYVENGEEAQVASFWQVVNERWGNL